MAVMFNKNFNVGRVISRLITGVLSLYVGGTLLTEFGTTMTNTSSALYTGLGLIGWTTSTTYNATYASCGTTATLTGSELASIDNCLTSTTGSGVLSVIGILVIAQVIMEFIQF